MTEPNTYATAFPRDEQWGEFLPWREKVGHLPTNHDQECCTARNAERFICCRPEGHDGPHVAASFDKICGAWEDGAVCRECDAMDMFAFPKEVPR